jgi:O-antigen/teichoic acid export membrane protein
MWDDQNFYVSQGTTSGLVTLILFIAIIVLCFRTIGLNLKTMKHIKMRHRLWGFGAAVFAHSVAFMGVSYFDQTIVAWYLLIAIISTISYLPKQLQELQELD